MTGRERVSVAYVEELAVQLSDRDRATVEHVAKTRVLTGAQIERLVFTDLNQPSRSVVRRRILARLVSLRILTTLQRRIGGVRGGSSGLVFALDSAGQQLMRLWQGQLLLDGQRVRRPWTPGRMFLQHTLAIAELYVRLVEVSREQPFTVSTFLVEPASWSPNGLSGWLKPDAYLVLSTEAFAEAVWLEVDRATETLPTIRRKLLVYLDFVYRGQLGPHDVIPRVVMTVPDEARRAAVAECINDLASAPEGLFTVLQYDQAVPYLTGLLASPNGPAPSD